MHFKIVLNFYDVYNGNSIQYCFEIDISTNAQTCPLFRHTLTQILTYLKPSTTPRHNAIAIGYQEFIKSSPGSCPPGNIFYLLKTTVQQKFAKTTV